MNIMQRALDRLRHPHEYPEQRNRRRYLEGLDQASPAEPYVLTTVGESRVAPAAPLKTHGDAYGTIVGVRIDHPVEDEVEWLADDADRAYDAAVDDAVTEAATHGDVSEWRNYMPGGKR